VVSFTMSYHSKTRHTLRCGPNTIGVRLGRLAIRKGVSVMQIASKTGASRATVYNWFAGGAVSNAYRTAVTQLLAELKTI
jgi:transcriptional regulator with XRE-family HTH domain